MNNLKALPYILLLGTLFGTNLTISRFSIGQFPPVALAAFRLTLAGLMFLLVFLISPKYDLPRDKRFWLRAGLWGIIGSAIPMSCFIAALAYQSSGVTSLLLTLTPVMTMVMTYLLVGDEKITWIKVMGVLIAILGSGMILLKGETGLVDLIRPDWRGYTLSFFGSLSAAGSCVFARRYLKQDDIVQATGIRMIVSAAFLLLFVFLTKGYQLEPVRFSGIIALLYLSILGTFVPFLLELFIIQRFGATAATQNNYVSPVVATSFGALFLNEQITITIVIGMIAIFAGLRMMNHTE